MKNLLLIVFLLIGTLSYGQSNPFQGLSKAPTAETCQCLHQKAVKKTSKTTTEGTATVYADRITFQFKSSVKVFTSAYGSVVWKDEKGKLYEAETDDEGIYIQVSSTLYAVSLKAKANAKQ